MSTRKRAPTVIIGLIVAFAAIQYFSRLWFFVFIQAVILIALIELYNLGRRRNVITPRWVGGLLSIVFGLSFYFVQIPLSLVLFAALFIAGTYFLLSIRKVEELMKFPTGMALTIFGVLYVSFTLNHFVWLRDQWGPYYIYFLLAVIFVGDSGAMYVGKGLGKHLLAPLASPKKTVEGAVGGLLTACLGGLAIQQLLLKDVRLWKAVLFALLIHFVAQMSDPVESLFKRAAGVKDSSSLLPGHGGFLDRIDSLIFAAPFYYYLLKYVGLS